MASSTRKTVIVTGSTAGLGYECARRIATEHSATHRVVIASRGLSGVSTAVESIQKLLKDEDKDAVVACGVQLDLNSLESVKSFAAWASQEYPTLDGLVLNAGIVPPSMVLSKDGLESTFAVNHLGHFYLTQLLLPNILRSNQPRVIVISSGMHNGMYNNGPSPKWTAQSPADWAYGDPSVYSALAAYPFSKLCNVLFAHELRARVADPRLTILVFDPGFCQTTGLRRGISWGLRSVVENGITAFLWIKDATGIHPHRQLSTTEESGGIMASFAVDDKWISSETSATPVRYFAIATETESSVDSYNKEYQKLLWEFSEKVVTEKMGGIAAL
ncbi:hypothetical protein BJ742DRAFT_830981 [Cladochytrium replicatum]|nr:hypothetical protein BJ742DRAFT_830981 [Cladochytrium replicatum]